MIMINFPFYPASIAEYHIFQNGKGKAKKPKRKSK